MAQSNLDALNKLKTMLVEVNWKIEEEWQKLLDQLYLLVISDWNGQLPDFRDIFRNQDIDNILTGAIDYWYWHDDNYQVEQLVDFMARSGFKDEPDVDEDGKPVLRRFTAVHFAVRQGCLGLVPIFFRIYNRFDMNYTDESGFTHFHAACKSGSKDVIEKFLELGQDPNCLVEETGDSPLHLVLKFVYGRDKNAVTKILLRNGADPNLTNNDGLTPLHIICSIEDCANSIQKLFEFFVTNVECHPVLFDVQDKSGDTPLHVALGSKLVDSPGFMVLGCVKMELVESLLRKGANANLANEEGSTPLHIICKCKSYYTDKNYVELMKLFFKINFENHKLVQIDAEDKLGRTPLQWAVANFLPDVVDELLNRGADLSCFVFPADSDFGDRFTSKNGSSLVFAKSRINLYGWSYLHQTTGALAVVECLKIKRYKVDRNDVLTIMKFFAKHGFFEHSVDLDKCWYEDNDFAIIAKTQMVRSNLSLYDLVRFQPEDAEKLFTYTDYYKFLQKITYWCLPEKSAVACVVHLYEQLLRRFFRRSTLDPFLELTSYQFPILCCEIIIQKLTFKDLLNICLAVTVQKS